MTVASDSPDWIAQVLTGSLIDNLGTGSYSGGGCAVTVAAAKRSYSTILGLVTNATVTSDNPSFQVTDNTRSLFQFSTSMTGTLPGASTIPWCIALVPFANVIGDELYFYASGGLQSSSELTVYGITGQMATFVVPSPGVPLVTAPVGGMQKATLQVAAGVTGKLILSAPGNGLYHRLHRIVTDLASVPSSGFPNVVLVGATSGYQYANLVPGYPNNGSRAENLHGQLAGDEDLNVSNYTSAFATAYLFYDTVATPTIN